MGKLSSSHFLCALSFGIPPFPINARSTLLSQMVSTVPGVKAISEPYSFVYLHGLYMREHITMETYRQLLRTLVRIQFKREEKVRSERETKGRSLLTMYI